MIIIVIILLFVFNSNISVYSKEKDDNKTIIEADKIFKKDLNTIIAIGNIEVKKNNQILTSDYIEYNQNDKIFSSDSNVKIFDIENKNILFSKNISISDDLYNANFDNGVLLFSNGSSIKSNHIKKTKNNDIFLYETKYFICPTKIYNQDITYEQMESHLDSNKNPLFFLKNSVIQFNTENKDYVLRNTVIYLWKIPIFYIPYIKFNANSNVTLLRPSFEYNSNYNFGISFSFKQFFEGVDNKYSLRLTPKYFTKGNYLLKTDFNIENIYQNYIFKFKTDIVNDNNASKEIRNSYGITEFDEHKYEKYRGKISLDGFYKIINNDLTVNYNTTLFSDRYYNRDYYHINDNYQQSNIKFVLLKSTDKTNFNYLQFSNLFYQELLELHGNTPRYAPIIGINFQNTIFNNNNFNSFYDINVNTTNLFRKKGIQYNRYSISPSINNIFKTHFGIFETNFILKNDYYMFDIKNDQDQQFLFKDKQNRVVSEINLDWRQSFFTKYFTIQPRVKYLYTKNINKDINILLNEDSYPIDINFNDIFSNNRYIGYDILEYGNRITYGIEGDIFQRIGYGIAQGYKEKNNLNLQLLGFEKKLSDYVGYLSYSFNENFNVYYRFMIDSGFNYNKKNELNFNLDYDKINIYIVYSQLKKDIISNYPLKQTNIGIIYDITEYYKLKFDMIMDIENNNRLLETDFNIIYDAECVRWELALGQDNPLTKTKKNTSIHFNFIVKFI